MVGPPTDLKNQSGGFFIAVTMVYDYHSSKRKEAKAEKEAKPKKDNK